MLALQRAAGNRAVTGLLQRKVGFEFEDIDWRPWKITGKGNHERVDQVERKESVHKGRGFRLEGDDSLGEKKPSAEFVTQPFEETDAGLDAAEQAMGEMTALSTRLDQNLGRPGPDPNALPGAPWGVGEQAKYATGTAVGVNGGKVRPEKALFSGGTLHGQVKMQVTSGISLAALPTAMAYLGGGQAGETAQETVERGPARNSLYPAAVPAEVDVMGAAPALARQALTNLRGALAGDAKAVAALANAAELEGLLAAMMMTLKMLQVPIDKQIKYRLPLMARTSFAAMFKTLPGEQRAVLKRAHATLAQELVNASNARPLLPTTQGVDPDTNLTLGSPLIRTSTPAPQFPGHQPQPRLDVAFAPVSIGDWVKGVTHGNDYLLPSEMDKFLKAAGTDKATRKHVLEDREMLESFGSVGGMDKRGKQKLAVFENRAIAPTPVPHVMPLAVALRIAWNQLLFFKALRENPQAPGPYPNLDVGQRPGGGA